MKKKWKEIKNRGKSPQKLKELDERVKEEVKKIEEENENYEKWKKEKIHVDERRMGGTPVFYKSRLSIYRIGCLHQKGISVKEILDDYPYLTEEDVLFSRRWVEEA